MEKLSQLVPKGVNDLHAEDFEIKEQTIFQLKKLFKKYEYKQIQTPVFEYYDLFHEIEGILNKDQMIKLIDTDGKILVLRPDATIPIARMVAQNYKNAAPLQRFSYVTSIFRMNEDLQNIQSREFTQAGVELFGKNGVEADVEIISLAIQSLHEVGVSSFTIDIGQANFFKKLVDQIDLPVEEMNGIQRLIEYKNFAELKRTVDKLDINEELKTALRTIPTLYGEPEDVFRRAFQIANNREMKEEIQHLKVVFETLVAKGYKRYLSLDLGLINHLNYYTSIVFQGFITGYGSPILLGGRYDNLTKQFGYDTKAIGFAIYVDRLIEAINRNKGGV